MKIFLIKEKISKIIKVFNVFFLVIIILFYSVFFSKTSGDVVLDKDIEQDGKTSDEKVLISQNITYLSPNIVLKVKEVKEKTDKIVISDNSSFSIPNEIDIDFKNSIESKEDEGKKDSLEDDDNIDENKIRYLARPGDTLESISKKFGVTIDTIKVENNLKSDKLKESQVLNILPTSGFVHTVRRGETISQIAQKFNASEENILEYNFQDDSSGSKINIGQEIIVPVKDFKEKIVKKAPVKKASVKKVQKNQHSTKTYNEKKKTPTKRIVSGNGWLTNPAPGSVRTQGIHGRNAVDLASKGHTYIPIVAAAAGKVTRARRTNGYWGGYGMNVLIAHPNGVQTLYAHMSSVSVYNGQQVAKGQIIGYMGNTGRSTGVHLHFEVRGARNPF